MPVSSTLLSYYLRNGVLLRRGVPTTPLLPTYPTPTLPAGTATILYDSIPGAVPGEDVGTRLNRLVTPAVVYMNAGLFELVDFTEGGGVYSCYAPNCLGIIGAGIDKTIIQMRENSSTKVGLVPIQSSQGSNPLTLMRLANAHILSMGFTLSGTNQPIDPNTGKPHTYSGWLHYRTTNSNLCDVKVTGIPGNWSSPPGETFAINSYKDTNTVHTRLEVDGYIWRWSDPVTVVKGTQVGGSPDGRNNSTNHSSYGCNYHDSLVSGFTSSFTGVPTDITAVTSGVFTDHLIIKNNANHVFSNGQTFPGVNHENVYGNIHYKAPSITMVGYPQWDVAHMVFDSRLGDNPNILIEDPVWNGSYFRFGGMFTLKTGINYAGVPNTQTTPPTVKIAGVTLTSHRYTSNPSTTQTFDPKLHYAWISG